MKLLQTVGFICIAGACSQALAYGDATSALYEGINTGDTALVTSALASLENAHQEVKLLPLLKRLQTLETYKRSRGKAIAWMAGVASPFAVLTGEVLLDGVLKGRFHEHVPGFLIAPSAFVGGPCAVYATYKAWVRHMRARDIAPIARLLLANDRVCVADAADSQKIDKVMNDLNVKNA